MRWFTNSEISCWSRCKRKWYLKYYLNLHAHSQPKYFDFGNQMHQVLEAYYGGSIDEGYDALDNVDEKDRKLATRMFEGYLEYLGESGADDWFNVVGVEQLISTPLNIDCIDSDVGLRGLIDLIVEDEHGRYNIDHKTGSQFLDPDKWSLDTQKRTYDVISFLNGDPFVAAIFNNLKKSMRTARAAPPFYRRDYINYDQNITDSHMKLVVIIVTEIMSAIDLVDDGADHREVFNVSPMAGCFDCEFRAVCPMFDNGTDETVVSGLLESSFVKKDPNERYTQKMEEANL